MNAADEIIYDNQIRLRLATKDDTKAVTDIMQEVYDKLSNKDQFVADSPEWISAMLSDSKRAMGIVAEDIISKEVVGFLIVTFKAPFDEENYGYDLGFDEKKRSRVANMESAAVLPKARGHHLERRMLDFAQESLDKKYIYLIGTVSPDNPASICSVEACGYKRMLTKEKYGSKMRHIYLKSLET